MATNEKQTTITPKQQDAIGSFFAKLQTDLQTYLGEFFNKHAEEAKSLNVSVGDVGYNIGSSLVSVVFELVRQSDSDVMTDLQRLAIAEVLKGFKDGTQDKTELLSSPEGMESMKVPLDSAKH